MRGLIGKIGMTRIFNESGQVPAQLFRLYVLLLKLKTQKKMI